MPRRFLPLLLVLCLSAAAGADEATRTVSGTFAGRTFTLEIPASYTYEQTSEPRPDMKMWAYASEPREDGTRAMVQVALGKAPVAIPLETFSEHMIKGVERRRENWKVDASDTTLSGLEAKRYAWSGIIIAEDIRRPGRGLMFVAVDGDIGISLTSQDVDEYAAEAIPVGEKALLTFKLR